MRVFTGIKELLTLAPAVKKEGRHVQESDLGAIRDAAIVEDQGRLLWIGEKKKLKRALKDLSFASKNTKVAAARSSISASKIKEISLQAECVIPAFLECHTHLVFAGDRQAEFEMRNQGATYQEIAQKGGGILRTVEQTRAASLLELSRLATQRAQKFVAQGVTVIEVKSGYGLSEAEEMKILAAAKKIPSPRIVSTYLGAHAIPKGRSAEDYLQEMVNETFPKLKKQKLAERVDMFVEKGYYTLAQAKEYFAAAERCGLRLTCHAEQLTYSGAAKWLASFQADSVDHLVQMEEADIPSLKDTTAVLLPTSDFYLKMKYPPARQLLDGGIRVALATDFNPGSSPTQDLSLVGVLARLEMKMKLAEVLAAYTVGAAYALHRQKELGSLESGKQCDFVVLDGSWRELFYQVGHHPVSQVIMNGKTIFLKKS